MSFENNRKDFEEALILLSETSKEMGKTINPVLLDMINNVVDEYTIHYSFDVDGFIEENVFLVNNLDVTEKRVCELLDENVKLAEELDSSKQNACELLDEISDLRTQLIRIKRDYEIYEI